MHRVAKAAAVLLAMLFVAGQASAQQGTTVAKLKDAKASKKPVLMKVYREGMTRFVAVSPRAA